MSDLGIRIQCPECGQGLGAPRPCGRDIQDGRGDCNRGVEDYEAYIPLKYVPEETVEVLRSEHLQAATIDATAEELGPPPPGTKPAPELGEPAPITEPVEPPPEDPQTP